MRWPLPILSEKFREYAIACEFQEVFTPTIFRLINKMRAEAAMEHRKMRKNAKELPESLEIEK